MNFEYTESLERIIKNISSGEEYFTKNGDNSDTKVIVKDNYITSVSDNTKINNIIETVNKVTPDWRMEQMLDKTFDLMNGGTIDIKKMGEFIKNVIADVMKEELATIAEAGLEPKDINSKVSERCRNYFFHKQNEEVGLV